MMFSRSQIMTVATTLVVFAVLMRVEQTRKLLVG